MYSQADLELIKSSIKSIPDHPKPGINFRDVTSLVEDGAAFAASIRMLTDAYRDKNITKVVGAEARGFVFGAAVAHSLNAGFVLARKPNKLPRATVSQSYALEYGEDQLHIHQDAIKAHDKVLLVDDLVATGGTIVAAIQLVRQLGGTVEDAAFVIALPDLGGLEKVTQLGVTPLSLVSFDGD